jgi:hypothetical protein
MNVKRLLPLCVLLLLGCQQSFTPPIAMHLTSSAFQQNELIPVRYTCDGEDVSPPLAISDVPEGAKSLALIVDDPDAPAGDFVHWLLWSIAPSVREILAASVPEGAVQGTTDFGDQRYGGPCPPSGTHRYFFKLYALDTAELGFAEGARKPELLKVMEGHILAETELIGLYIRERR